MSLQIWTQKYYIT